VGACAPPCRCSCPHRLLRRAAQTAENPLGLSGAITEAGASDSADQAAFDAYVAANVPGGFAALGALVVRAVGAEAWRESYAAFPLLGARTVASPCPPVARHM